MAFALTLRSFTSTLLPQRTIGIFSQTRTRSPIAGQVFMPLTVGRRRVPTMPVGNILVGDTGCDIKHDDSALTVDVVSVS